MPVHALFWEPPAKPKPVDEPPHPSRLALLTRTCAALLILAVSTTALAVWATVVTADLLERQPMHPIPKAELIHTELGEGSFLPLDTDTPSSPSPPPPVPPPPSSRALPFWVRESMLPPRPLSATAVTSDTDPTHRWAYLVRDARPGTILIGGGALSVSSGLRGAVVLLLHVCSHQPFIYGVVLNRPMEETMSSAFCPVAAARYPSFLNNTVRSGGPNGPHWTILAPTPSPSAREVLPGLYAGGCLTDLHAAVDAGVIDASAVDFFDGYVSWRIDALGEEVEAGLWTVVRASAAVLSLTADGSAEALAQTIKAALA